MTILKESPEENFKALRLTSTFLDTLNAFQDLCKSMGIKENDDIYCKLRNLQSSEAKPLWACLAKRGAHHEYHDSLNQQACKGKQVLIIGAGPCGLRMAIECALLGAQVTVIDMRQYISRNNVLHLWPFVIQDIKLIGGKVFNPKFCVGPIDHVSIKRLQLLLLKISLILGVKVYTPVKFQHIIDPDNGRGWHVSVTPEDHCVNNMDFDFIIGANGKNNTLADFKRKTTRGKLAIAITANFVNKQSTPDAKVQELGGLSFIFDQEFFNGLKEKTGADLENLIYYKDDTHYFVMTPKKKCLLANGVIKEDFLDCKKLLARENIDPDKLRSFARDVAMASTNNELPSRDFEVNHHNEDDIAIFDFTSISMANNSCFAKEKNGHVLLQCIVGDSLLEPFWPTGTGCARGFLSVFDCAWLLRTWSSDDPAQLSKIHMIAERESIFRILSQSKPEAQMKVINKYTIDPVTRYGTKIKTKTMMSPKQVKHLYVKMDSTSVTQHNKPEKKKTIPPSPFVQSERSGDVSIKVSDRDKQTFPQAQVHTKQPPVRIDTVDHVPTDSSDDSDIEELVAANTLVRKRNQGTLNSRQLLSFYQNILEPFSDIVTVKDLAQSWLDGLALCAVIQVYRPSEINIYEMSRDDVETTLEVAFVLIEQEFGVSPMMSAEDMVKRGQVDKLAMLSYLAQIRQSLENEPVAKMPRYDQAMAIEEMRSEEQDPFLQADLVSISPPPLSPLMEIDEQNHSLSPYGMLVKMSNSTALQDLQTSVEKATAWMDDKNLSPHRNVNKESMRKTILASTSQMPPSLRRSGLTRKKVLFKETPQAVLKYRESQHIDIGQTNVPTPEKRGILASGSYDNNLDSPEVRVPRLGPGRPSLAHCRGIAGQRIKNWQPQPKVSEHSPPVIKKLPVTEKDSSATSVINKQQPPPYVDNKVAETSSSEDLSSSSDKSPRKEKQKSKNVFNRLKRLGRKKDDDSQLQDHRSSKDVPPKKPPRSRGLEHVPNKALQSMSYVACLDRKKADLSAFQGGQNVTLQKQQPIDEDCKTGQDKAMNIKPNPHGSPKFTTRLNLEVAEEDSKQNTSRRGLAKVPNQALQSMSYMACLDRKKPNISVFQGANTSTGNQPVSSVCCMCDKRLYLVERHSAHGQFFHKCCYKCHTCGTLLRHGNSVMKKTKENKVEFFCFSHAYTAGVFDVEWETQQESENSSTAPANPELPDAGFHLNLSEHMEDVWHDTQDHMSSEDDSSDDEVYVSARPGRQHSLKYQKSMRSQKSLRLLVADEIQRGLDKVDEDEEILEREGHDVEEKIRQRQSEGADDADMEEWLEVLRRKKELVDKESKLMLKKKLVELQDRHNRLQFSLVSLGTGANTDQGLQDEMQLLESHTEELEGEITSLVDKMSSLSTYLDDESAI